MARKLKEDPDSENEAPIHFLSDQEQAKLEKADANPFVKISVPDKSIPFIVLADGGVVADIEARNFKTILENLRSVVSDNNLHGGAGFIDVYHGNQILVFRQIVSSAFGKKWLIDDIVSALQFELNVYYPGYQIRSY